MNSKKQKKTIVGLLVSIIALLMFTIGMTFAYFTASNSTTSSSMTFGTLGLSDVTIATDTTCSHAKTGNVIDKLVPGCSLTLGSTNNITVTGNIAAFVRATVTITAWQKCDANGTPYTYENLDGTATTGVTGVNAWKTVSGALTSFTPSGANDANVEFYGIKTEADNVDAQSNEFASVIFTSMGDINGWIAYTDAQNHTRYYYPTAVTNSQITFTDTFTLSATALGNAWQGAVMQVELVVDAVQAEHLLNDVTSAYTIVASNAGANQVTVATVAASSAWADEDGVVGSSTDSANSNPYAELEEESLPYLEFIPVSSTGAFLGEATPLSENNSEMNSLNDINANLSALMTGNGTLFAAVQGNGTLESVDESSEDDAVDLAIPGYIKIGENGVETATPGEWEQNQAYKVIRIIYGRYYDNEFYGNYGDGFYGVNIKSIVIPETIEYIETGSINDCSRLTSVYYNAVDAKPGWFENDSSYNIVDPFYYAVVFAYSGDDATLTIGSSVEVIYGGVFAAADLDYSSFDVANLVFEENSHLTTIGDCAFIYCTDITSIDLPSSVTSIGSRAFAHCTGLTSITIPGISIGERVLYDCENIETIILANTITAISWCAFDGCRDLISIVIPTSVTSIAESIFVNCNNDPVIYYMGTQESWNLIEGSEDYNYYEIIYNYNPES